MSGTYTPTPTVTAVNGGAAITEGATGVTFAGTGFNTAMTGAIVQGTNSVAQTSVTDTNPGTDTAGTFTLTMEPGTGTQLAFFNSTDNFYASDFEITYNGNTSVPFALTGLAPASGLIFKTLTSVNPVGSYRITAVPDLVANDQLEASSTSTGLPLGAPAGLSVSTSTTGGTGLAASTTYYYEVTGLTAGGESVGQTAVSVTTGAGSTNSNNVTWTALTGAESYRVYRSLSSSMTSAVYYTATTNSFTDTGATGTSGSVPTTDTTAAAPPGLVLNSDATFEYGSGYSAASFYVRAYDSSTSAWDAYALQTVSTGDLASAGYNVSTAKAATFTSAIHLGAGGRNVSTGEATLNTVIPFSTRGGNISRGAGSFLTSISFFASGSSRNSGTASASTSITLAAAGRDRSTGSSEASTAIRLGAHGFNRSAALGTPTTAIVLRANGYDVSGGVGEPFTQISLRSYGLGVNTGTGDLRFQAVFSASGRSVSTGRGEPSTLVSLKSAGRNRVESFGLIAYGVTFIARGASTSRGTGTLSTSIALRALGQNVSTSLNAFRIVLRYGYSTVVPVSNTGVQAAESAYVSGSALYVDCAYFDSTGLPFVPNGLSYRVDDVASGMNIVPATALPVATTTTIQITGAQNYMVNLSRSFEEHQITVAITDGYGQTYYRTATYDVVAPGWSA